MTFRRGEARIDLLMCIALPVIGGTTGTLFFRQVTSLPLWGCVILGIPIGTAATWCAFTAIAFLDLVPAEKWSYWNRDRSRRRIKKP